MTLDLSKLKGREFREGRGQSRDAPHCIEIKAALLNCGIQHKCSCWATLQQSMGSYPALAFGVSDVCDLSLSAQVRKQ